MSSTIASFFSSFLPTIHADAPPSEKQTAKEDSDVEVDAEEVVEKADSKVEAVVEKVVADDAEEEEPEDVRVFNAHHSRPLFKIFVLIAPACHSRGM